MNCCGCGTPSNGPSARGVLVKRIETRPGAKSGALVSYPEPFTDGLGEKYICDDCFVLTEAARLVGDYDQGHDVPPDDYEVPNARRTLPCLPTPFQTWR